MRRVLSAILTMCWLASCWLAPCAFAEDMPFAWELRFGADGFTTPYSMESAPDGGLFVVGATDSGEEALGKALGGKDAFVLRIGPEGETRYAARFGGSGDDVFTKVLKTPDGGCIAIGTTTSTDGDARASRGGTDGFAVRLSAEGETLWVKCLGGTMDDELLSVAMCDNGTFLVCGRSKSRNGDLRANMGGWDAMAALLSDEDAGKPLWAVRYGQGGDDQFIEALPVDNGWLLLGVISEEISMGEGNESTYRERPIVLLLSDMQEEIFLGTLGGNGVNHVKSAQKTELGWLFLGETSTSSVLMQTPHGGLDTWLLHLRGTGALAWQRAYGGTKDETAHSFAQLPVGDIAILSTTNSTDGQVYGAHGGGADLWLICVSQSGGLKWQQALGGSSAATPAGFVVTNDGEYLVAGTTTSQDGDFGPHTAKRAGFVTRLASNGNLLSTTMIGGETECELHSIIAAEGGAYLLGSLLSISLDGPVETLFIAKVDASRL